MKFTIIVSKKDLAGLNIKNNLAKHFNFLETKELFDENIVLEDKKGTKLYTINSECSQAEEIDKKIKSEIILFATRHQSSAGIISFTTHVPGNFTTADYGGKDNFLGIANSNILTFALENISEISKENNITGVEISFEATHHGPKMDTQSLFMEIGSSEKEWNNESYGKIIAEAIVKTIYGTPKNNNNKTAIVLGGTHYNTAANKAIQNGYNVGHICAKYALESLTNEKLDEMLNKTIPKPETIILDWKGLGQFKEKVKELTEGKNTIRIQDL